MMRTALVLVLLAPVLAGCLGQADTVLTAQLDQAAPHCVGGCARIVDDSPARAWEPFLAVNPRNEDHLVIAYSEPWEGWYDTYSGTGRSHIVVSEDGGTTWEAIVVPSGLDLGSEHPLAKYRSVGYDPVVVFLPDGTLVMSALAANDVATPESPYILRQGVALYTQRSLDGGRTWGDVRIIDPGEGVEVGQCCSRFVAGAMWTFNDKEWLAVGPDGTLLLVWTKFAMVHPENGLEQPLAARLLASTSEDGGLTWSSPRMIDGEGRPLGPSPVIGLDGVWRVTYTDIVGDILRFAESRDRGETWDIRTIGSTSWLAVMRTQTLASGIERLLLAYTTGGDSYSGQHQTELTWSDDGGAMWAPPLIVDPPEGEGHTMPDVVGAPGDSAWVTFFDLEGSDAAQHSRYLAVKVVNGVAGAPLVLDEMEMAAETLGNYMGLGVTPSGDAIVAWATGRDGQYDIAFARVRAGIGYVPGATDWALAQPGVPTGLDEPVAYEFNGHLDVAGCYAEVDPALEPFVRHEIEFEFDVPADTRYINGTLEWSTHGPPASPTDLDDLDVSFYDAEGDRWRGTDDVPETFEFELHEGDQGAWTALVYNCENMPTDFTLTLGLS